MYSAVKKRLIKDEVMAVIAAAIAKEYLDTIHGAAQCGPKARVVKFDHNWVQLQIPGGPYFTISIKETL